MCFWQLLINYWAVDVRLDISHVHVLPIYSSEISRNLSELTTIYVVKTGLEDSQTHTHSTIPKYLTLSLLSFEDTTFSIHLIISLSAPSESFVSSSSSYPSPHMQVAHYSALNLFSVILSDVTLMTLNSTQICWYTPKFVPPAQFFPLQSRLIYTTVYSYLHFNF